jgi:serine/threonine protein kinase
MELGDGGDMFGWLRRNKDSLNEPRARNIFAQLVLAMCYCHKHKVAHRDLKPENVIFYTAKEEGVAGQEIVKVTDFGLSRIVQDNTMMDTWCGSLAYSAPEVLVQEPYLGPQADIWGLGIILYMLVCYVHPFEGHDENDTLIRIMDVRCV